MDLPDPSISIFDGPSWVDWVMVIVFLVFVAGLMIWVAVD